MVRVKQNAWVILVGFMTLTCFTARSEETVADLVAQATVCLREGRYADSEPFFRRALVIQEKALGCKHPFVANTLFNLALVYVATARASEAESALQRALTIREKAIGTNSVQVAEVLSLLGTVYVSQGRYADSASVRTRALAIQTQASGSDELSVAAASRDLAQVLKELGKYKDAELLMDRALSIGRKAMTSPSRGAVDSVAYTLSALGNLKVAQGDYNAADTYFSESLRIREAEHGRDSVLDGTLLAFLGEVYIKQARFEEAEKVLNRARAIQGRIPGGDQATSYATILTDFGELFRMQHRFAEAEPMYKQALAIRSKALGDEHPNLAPILCNMATLFVDQRRYTEAEPLLKRIMSIQEKTLGPDHPDMVQPLLTTITLLIEQGRHNEAEATAKHLVSIQEKHFGSGSPALAETLRGLADLYVKEARFAEADPLFRRALLIQENAGASARRERALTLNGLALSLKGQGRYAEAKSLYEQALNITTNALGPESPAMVGIIGNLGSLYADQGLYAEAEPLLRRSLAMAEKVFGTNSYDLVVSLNELARLQASRHQSVETVQLYLRALEIQKKVFGAEHPALGTLYNNLAGEYQSQGRLVEAAAAEQFALNIFAKVYGSNHPSIAQVFNNLSCIYSFQGRFTDAVLFSQQALKIVEKCYGPNHPETAVVLRNLATAYFIVGDNRTLPTAERAFDLQSRLSASSFTAFSERQRMAYVSAKGDSPISEACSIALKRPEQRTQAVSLGCLWTLRSKGLVLDSMMEDHQNLAGNPGAFSVFESLRDVRGKIASVQFKNVQSFTEEALVEHRQLLESLNARQTELEQKLAQLAGNYRSGRRAATVTVKDVRQALATNEVLLEFVRFNPLATTNEFQAGLTRMSSPHPNISNILFPEEYACFAVSPDSEQPGFVTLGPAAAIDRLVTDCRAAIRNGEDATVLLRRLYDSVWVPVQGLVQGKKRVIISPDGELSFLSFGGLMEPDGTYLIERQEIGYVATGRDLVKQFDRTSTNTPALFGDPAFGEEERAGDYLDRSVAFRSVFDDKYRSAMTGMRFSQLPGTRKEVENLRGVFQDGHVLVAVYLGAEASEGQLKALSRPEVLHLATHGFFLPDVTEVDAKPVEMMPVGPRTGQGQQSSRIENPMLRSGLALTGAALALAQKGPAGSPKDDGIVTAEEVSSLDLWGTRLVVLSACDTGMGEARAGQGVIGLRRAFVHAGAKNLMMTLWPVQDEATSQLMVEFYRKYLETDDAVGAINAVQRAAIAKAREKGTQPNPRLWAPFLVSVQGRN